MVYWVVTILIDRISETFQESGIIENVSVGTISYESNLITMSKLLTVLYLLLAILFEVAGTTQMKFSEGFTQIQPSVLIFVFYIISFVFLALTLKRLEVSFAYAIWSGIGTLLIAFIGVFFFHEPINMMRLFSLGLIVIGVVGLKQNS